MVGATVTCRPASPPPSGRACAKRWSCAASRQCARRNARSAPGLSQGSRRVVVPAQPPAPRARGVWAGHPPLVRRTRRRAARRNGCGHSRREGGPYHGRQEQRRQAQGRLGAGHGLPPAPLDGLIGEAGRGRALPARQVGKTKDSWGQVAGVRSHTVRFKKPTCGVS